MSERPFMQLYVSDFIGDTLHLSTEQVGAYLLLLMAMWNAGGELPDDEVKLARIVRMSVKKWRAVAIDLLAFFERGDGAVRHNRLSKELLKSEGKSQSRASAGAKGGRAKALKDNAATVANATPLPQHLPDTRDQKEIEPIAQQHEPAAAPRNRYDVILDALLEANGISGFRDERNPGLANLAPIMGLIEAGYDLERDICAAIRAKPNAGARNWRYFEGQIRDYRAQRVGAASKAAPPDQATTTAAWPVEKWRPLVQHWQATGNWNREALGPAPREAGCRAPAELWRAAA